MTRTHVAEEPSTSAGVGFPSPEPAADPSIATRVMRENLSFNSGVTHVRPVPIAQYETNRNPRSGPTIAGRREEPYNSPRWTTRTDNLCH